MKNKDKHKKDSNDSGNASLSTFTWGNYVDSTGNIYLSNTLAPLPFEEGEVPQFPENPDNPGVPSVPPIPPIFIPPPQECSPYSCDALNSTINTFSGVSSDSPTWAWPFPLANGFTHNAGSFNANGNAQAVSIPSNATLPVDNCTAQDEQYMISANSSSLYHPTVNRVNNQSIFMVLGTVGLNLKDETTNATSNSIMRWVTYFEHQYRVTNINFPGSDFYVYEQSFIQVISEDSTGNGVHDRLRISLRVFDTVIGTPVFIADYADVFPDPNNTWVPVEISMNAATPRRVGNDELSEVTITINIGNYSLVDTRDYKVTGGTIVILDWATAVEGEIGLGTRALSNLNASQYVALGGVGYIPVGTTFDELKVAFEINSADYRQPLSCFEPEEFVCYALDETMISATDYYWPMDDGDRGAVVPTTFYKKKGPVYDMSTNTGTGTAWNTGAWDTVDSSTLSLAPFTLCDSRSLLSHSFNGGQQTILDNVGTIEDIRGFYHTAILPGGMNHTYTIDVFQDWEFNFSGFLQTRSKNPRLGVSVNSSTGQSSFTTSFQGGNPSITIPYDNTEPVIVVTVFFPAPSYTNDRFTYDFDCYINGETVDTVTISETPAAATSVTLKQHRWMYPFRSGGATWLGLGMTWGSNPHSAVWASVQQNKSP